MPEPENIDKEVENPEGIEGKPSLEIEGEISQAVLEAEGLEAEPAEAEPEAVKPKIEIDPEIEKRAKLQGWVPKVEFRGDPERWISAEDFVRRADEMMPILKGVNKKLENKLEQTESELAEMRTMVNKMVKIQSKYSEDFYDSRLEDIKAQKVKAVEAGDTALYKELEVKEAAIVKPEIIEVPETKQPPATQDGIDPGVQKWMEEKENLWFHTDPQLRDYAVFVGETMRQSNHPLAEPNHGYEFCQAVKDKVKATFPNKFANPNQNISEIDESNIRGGEALQGEGGQKKTWNDLPDAAKKQAEKLIADMKDQGMGYTKEQYVRDYFEQEGA